MIWAISAGQPDLIFRGRAALDAGLDRLLVREPNVPAGLVSLIADFPGRVVLHGRMEGAAAMRRETGVGVHLSAAGEPAEWLASAGDVGQSCHSVAEVQRARQAGCAWAFLSPIWAPFSKPLDQRPPLGPEVLAGTGAVALGGINVERASACRRHGAVGVASMSGILSELDPGAAVVRWRLGWNAE